MNIAEKLKLQLWLGGVVFFKEGVFLRAYNESAYILTELLGQDLTINCYEVKRIERRVAMCAFPYHKLHERLPTAKLTDFGAVFAGEFNLANYAMWFKEQCRHALEESKTTPARKKGANASFTRAAAAKADTEILNNMNFTFTPKQINYLIDWQKGERPIEDDLNFIDELRIKLLF